MSEEQLAWLYPVSYPTLNDAVLGTVEGE